MQRDYDETETNYGSLGIDAFESKEVESDLKLELRMITGPLSEEAALKRFGLTQEEFNNPTVDTLDRVRKTMFEEEVAKTK